MESNLTRDRLGKGCRGLEFKNKKEKADPTPPDSCALGGGGGRVNLLSRSPDLCNPNISPI